MTFRITSRFRNALLWIAPLALLSGNWVNAQWASPYGYQDEHSHQHNEKHAIKDHQREERFLYGNSRELRQHQKEERRHLKHHQRDERRDRYSDRYRDDDRSGYYGQRY